MRTLLRLGPYSVHEQLGSGGMAVVHRASIDNGTGIRRELALKRLRDEHATAHDDRVTAQDERVAAQRDEAARDERVAIDEAAARERRRDTETGRRI